MRRRMTPILIVAMIGGLVGAFSAPAAASNTFDDVPDTNVFHDDIEWLEESGITRGCNPPQNTEYCPEREISRGEMAAFFVRGLDLTDTDGGTDFVDTDDSVFVDDILKLSAAGITRGCNPPDNTEYCPDRSVSRGEMAAFFVRALNLMSTDGGTDFVDTDDSVFEEDILKLSAAGITLGCNPPDNTEYCPNDPVTREQMAAFFHRSLGGPLDLTIAHINDHHSHLQSNSTTLTLDGEDTDVSMGGFARVATKIADIDASNQNVLKVHAGDAITGTLFYTLFLGEADAAVMNEVCFDVFEVGNHEFDGSDEGLAMFLDWLNEGDCDTVSLGANVSPAPGTPIDGYLEPYTVMNFEGKRVGIIGIDIANKTKNSSQPLETTEFLDEVDTTQTYVDELQGMGIEHIVAVTHYQYDNDQALAAAVDGLDVVVGGDSHSLLGDYEPYGLGSAGDYPTIVENPGGDPVCVVQAWQFSNVVGQLDVSWDQEGVVTECGGHPTLLLGDDFTREQPDPEDPEEEIDVPLEGQELAYVLAEIEATPLLEIVAEDGSTAAVIESFAEEVDALAAEVIGEVTEVLCSERIPGQGHQESPECPADGTTADRGGDIQQLVTEAFRVRSFESDIAIQNGGGVRLQVNDGDFTIADAYELLPFANTMVNLEMTGAEIVDVLNDAFDFALQPDGSTGAYPYGAGIRWTTNFDTGEITGVEVRLKGETDWSPIEPGTTYTVVTNSFIAQGFDGYDTFAEVLADGRGVDTGLDYAQTFIDYILDELDGVISPVPDDEYSTNAIVGAYTP